MEDDSKLESSIFREMKEIFQHSFIYGFGRVASKSIGFIMIPIYTRYLTPADYGIIELIDLVLMIAGLILYDLIVEAIFRFYHKYDDMKDKMEIVSSALVAHGFITLIFAGIGLALIEQVSTFIMGSDQYVPYYLISFTTFIFVQFRSIPIAYLRVKKKSKMFVAVSWISLLLSISLNIYLIVFRKMGIFGVLYSGLISNGITALFLGIKTYAEVGFKFSWKKFIVMFKYGAPMIPSGVGMFTLNFSNRFFLNKFALLSDVGLYSLGARFGFMIHVLIIQPFLGSWDAKMFEIAKEKNAKEIYARTLTYFLFVVILCALAMSLLIKDALKIVATPSFFDAYKIVPLLCLGYVFMSFYYHFYVGILLKERTVFIGIITGSAAIISLALNWIFIPLLGMMGAALALTLSYLSMSVAAYIFSHRLYPIKYEWGRIIKLGVTALIIYFASTILIIDSIVTSIGVRLVLIMAFPVFLWVVGFYRKDEVNKIKEMVMLLIIKVKKFRLKAI